MKRSLILALLASLLLNSAAARLGETLPKLRERFGKPLQTPKDAAVWLFEAEQGQLVFNVTFNAKGQSIAEGLKPIKRAIFSRETAENFIETQVAPYRGSKTLLTVKPGEKYRFGGQVFTCAEQEYTVVDDANDCLVVWNKGAMPSVIAISHEMVKP